MSGRRKTLREKYNKLLKENKKLKKEFEFTDYLLKKEKSTTKRLRFEKQEVEYLLHTCISLINDSNSDLNNKIV